MISRRFFLASSGVLVLGGLLGVYVAREDALVAVLKKNLPEGEFRESDYHAFSKDLILYLKESNRIGGYKNKMAALGGATLFYYLGGFNLLSENIKRFEEFVVTKYVLSTDYFDENRTSQMAVYRYLHLPFRQPCSNIFSRRRV